MKFGIIYLATTAAAVVLTGVCAAANTPPTGPGQADRLTIVDCLLPAQVRKLGRQMTYLSPRRPMQTTAGDCEIRGGEYAAFDRASYATALKVWLPQAEAGDPNAQTHVGEIYEKGLGLSPDYPLAAAWYRKAADQGYSRAQINLGYLYEAGLGVQADPAMALNLYRQASGLVDDDLMYVSAAEAQMDELRSEMKLALAQAGAQTQALEESLRQSETRLADRRRSLEQAQRDLKAALTEHNKASSTVADPADAEALASMRNELALREQLIASQRDSIATLQQKTETQRLALIDDLTRQKDSDVALRAALAELRQQLDSTRQELASARSSYQAELAALSQNKVELQNAKSAGEAGRDSRIRYLTSQLTQREADLLLKDREISDLESRLQTYDQRVAQIQSSERVVLRAIDARPEAAPEATLTPERVRRDVNFGTYYALIIGNNEYRHLPRLDTAVNDARAVDQTLRSRYGYKTTLLADATRGEILTALNNLRQKLNEEDNLLIYYAGHGELDRTNVTGYWMPVDAKPEDTTNWISDDQITRQLNLMSARHIIVVADSCYSGAMTRNSGARLEAGRSPEAKLKRLAFLSKLPSRTVLTSGGEKPVLDGGGGEHSVFARSFLQVLQSNEDVLEGQVLYRRLFDDVRNSAARLNVEQNPQYSGIADAGHLNGEFLFVPLG